MSQEGRGDMQGNIIERLYASFTDLESAIESAKNTLAQKASAPEEVIKRLDSYGGILAKQRTLASQLCEHIKNSEWDEVTRMVSLINGLSAMIRDDARAILTSLAVNSDPKTDEEVTIC